MVILHVFSPGEIGGLERVVHALAVGHAARGHEMHVAAVLTDGTGDLGLLRSLEERGVAVERLRVSPRGYWAERAGIAAVCGRVRPDVMHTHGYRPDVVDGGAARRRGIPVVTTVHGRTSVGWSERLYEWLQYRTFRRFDAVVAVSQPLVAVLERHGVPRQRVHLIRNAWDRSGGALLDRGTARRALGVPVEGLRIGWVGRLSPEKGPDVLVEAARLARSDVAVSVLGEGPAAGRLRARTRVLGLEHRITWHGLVPGAERLYRAFDAFLLSSRTEGTPIVLFEAMAAGVPIVATAVGGVPDVVSPAEAMLVAPDDPAALAAALDEVFQHPLAAERRAASARARLHSDFALGPWLDRYETLYRLVTHAAARPTPT